MPSASLLVWLLTRSLLLPHQPATLSLSHPLDLPVASSVPGLIETVVAPVTSDRFDASGAGVAVPARIGAYANSWTETTYRLGDLDITNPLRPGTPMVLPDAAGLDSMSITTAPSLAEASATGPRIDLAPLRPGAAPAFVFEGVFSPNAWAASTTSPPAISALQSIADASVAVSGPIAGDRAGGAIAAHFTSAERTDRGQVAPQGTLASFTGNFVGTFRPHEEIRALGVFQAADHPLDDWLERDNAAQARDRLSLFHLGWERHDADRLGLRIAGGVQHAYLDPTLTTTTASIDSVNDGAVLPILLQPAGGTTIFRLAAEMRRRSSSQSSHDWRLGATFDRAAMHLELLSTRGALEFVDGQSARIWQFFPAASPSLWHQTSGAIFAADRVKLGARVSVEGSVRFESLVASNGGQTNVSWTDVYPRALVTATISKDAGVRVFLDVSRAGMPLPPMALAFGDPLSPTGAEYSWNDANHDGRAQLSERGPLIAAIGPGSGSSGLSEIDSGLVRPSVIQTIAGISVDRPRWAATFAAILRRTSKLIQVVDTGAEYTLIQVPDEGINYPGPKTSVLDTYSRTPASFGRDHYVLTNAAGPSATFDGLDASLQWRSNHVTLAFGATASRGDATLPVRGFRVDEADTGVLDLAANPNALVNARGRPFFDRGYTGKVAIDVRLPHDVRVGAIFRYQDGQPFSRLAVGTGLSQGPEPIRAYAPGLTRFTFVGTVDVRVQKDLALGHGRLSLFLDAFNVFDADREVEEIVATSAAFRTTSAVAPPFSLRFGLRVRF